MGLGNFLKHFGSHKLKETSTSLQDAIVGWDPEGATEAAIAQVEENFDKVNRQFSEVKQEWLKEQKEADQITKNYDQRIAAAEKLQADIEAGVNVEESTAGLNALIDSLEEMRADVEAEQQEAADAKMLMEELQKTVDVYATKLKGARKQAKTVSSGLKRAQAQEKRAEQAEERAKQAAGLASSSDGMSSALESMQRRTADAQASADAATRKAKLLTPANPSSNDAVAQALASVSGESTKSMSVSDRLSALKG